jgi:prepilin-type processing-associated H-X9-DG protein
VRRAAARSRCANNLKQIGLGLYNYTDTHPAGSDTGPKPAWLPAGTIASEGLSPKQRLSWFVSLLPFVEQAPLYRQIDLKAAWDAPANTSAVQTGLKIFHCPDWGREKEPDPPYLTAYIGVAGRGKNAATLPARHPGAGVFGYDRRIGLLDIGDGTSNTLLVLESARDNGPWAQGGPATVRGLDPVDQPYLGTGRPFGGTHFAENTVFGRGGSIGCNAAMADGSVRFFRESVAPHVLEALATVGGGEDPGNDW